MRKLNFRTAPDGPERKPIRKRGNTPVIIATGPKCYFVRRCPWTGYFYAKGGRERRCNGSYQRAIRGMKWNHYMREGLKALKNHASELMFFVNLSISWGLIKRWRARGGSMPGMPLQEGIMGETIRVRLPGNLPGRNERRSRNGRKPVRPEGRARIEAAERKTEGPKGTETPSTPTRRLDDDDDEVRDVMWFPGLEVIKESPESYVKLVKPVHTKLLIAEEKPPKRRKPSGKRRTAVKAEGSTPLREETKKPPKARDNTAIIRNPKVRKKKAPRSVSRRVVAARKQEKPAMVRVTSSPEPKAREIKAPRWVYKRQHRPTVSSAQKKVKQLKVARADDPNLPR